MPVWRATVGAFSQFGVCQFDTRQFDARQFDAFYNGNRQHAEHFTPHVFAFKVGLYFRRRQALSHGFIRLSRKRSSAQDATKFNGAELSCFTPANASNSANHLPVSRIEFAADRFCNYVRELARDNQLVTSES